MVGISLVSAFNLFRLYGSGKGRKWSARPAGSPFSLPATRKEHRAAACACLAAAAAGPFSYQVLTPSMEPYRYGWSSSPVWVFFFWCLVGIPVVVCQRSHKRSHKKVSGTLAHVCMYMMWSDPRCSCTLYYGNKRVGKRCVDEMIVAACSCCRDGSPSTVAVVADAVANTII
jgi:hypothetical protein